MSDTQQPGFLMAIWFAFIAFLSSFFFPSSWSSSSAAVLPTPVTARSPTSTPVVPGAQFRVSHQNSRVKHPSPSKCTSSAASSTPISSSAPTSQSATPRRTPECIFHSPAGPFPDISLSGLFATPPSLASLASLPEHQPAFLPDSSIHGSRGVASPSVHTVRPRTPSSDVALDRSFVSPTTMSDGSLEVVSLGDQRGFSGSPVRLPSPWSPIGASTFQDVWMSVDGVLMSATGPATYPTSATPGSRTSAPLLYSSSSALDAFGISVFVNLGDTLSNEAIKTDTKKNSVLESNLVHDEKNSTLSAQGPRTPRKRRGTIPSGASGHTSRATKRLSTPLARIENVDVSHLRSASSFSSMAYEFRMGLIADGRSMTAIENIISILDQDSPERTQPFDNSMQPVEVV